MAEYLMGLDNGGTVIKAAVFDMSGNEISVASRKPELLTPRPGHTERDMEMLWESNCECIREAISAADISSDNIVGIGCTGHGKGLYLWGYDEKPAYNGIVSTDQRAYAYPKKWHLDGTYAKVRERTMQEILACQPVSLLAWLRDNQPAVIRNTKYIFSVKDYIRYRLTEKAYSEITDLSGTNMMNLVEKRIDREVLECFGLEDIIDKIPPLKLSYDICGYITERTACITGLKKGTPVAGGMFDIDACAVAMDTLDEKDLCVIAGTWSINEYISKIPVTNGSILMNSLFCVPGYYLIEESSPTSAGNNEWFVNIVMDGKKTDTALMGKSVFEIADEMVASISAKDQEIVFLPFIFGSNEDFLAKAAFIGLSSYHKKAHMLRAVYEGVVFAHLSHLQKLFKNREKPEVVRLAGGATKSPTWVQIFADVFQLPIEIIDTKEIGSLGCAMAASIAAGRYKDYRSASNSMVKHAKPIMPNPENAAVYQKKYSLYREIVSALSDKWSLF